MDPVSFDALSPGHILNADGKPYRIEKVGECWVRQDGVKARIITVADSDVHTLTVTADDKRFNVEAGTFIYSRSVSSKLRLVASNCILQRDVPLVRLTHNHPMFELASEAMKRMQRMARKKGIRSLQGVAEATLTPLHYTLTYIKGDNVFLERILLRDLSKLKVEREKVLTQPPVTLQDRAGGGQHHKEK